MSAGEEFSAIVTANVHSRHASLADRSRERRPRDCEGETAWGVRPLACSVAERVDSARARFGPSALPATGRIESARGSQQALRRDPARGEDLFRGADAVPLGLFEQRQAGELGVGEVDRAGGALGGAADSG